MNVCQLILMALSERDPAMINDPHRKEDITAPELWRARLPVSIIILAH